MNFCIRDCNQSLQQFVLLTINGHRPKDNGQCSTLANNVRLYALLTEMFSVARAYLPMDSERDWKMFESQHVTTTIQFHICCSCRNQQIIQPFQRRDSPNTITNQATKTCEFCDFRYQRTDTLTRHFNRTWIWQVREWHCWAGRLSELCICHHKRTACTNLASAGNSGTRWLSNVGVRFRQDMYGNQACRLSPRYVCSGVYGACTIHRTRAWWQRNVNWNKYWNRPTRD